MGHIGVRFASADLEDAVGSGGVADLAVVSAGNSTNSVGSAHEQSVEEAGREEQAAEHVLSVARVER